MSDNTWINFSTSFVSFLITREADFHTSRENPFQSNYWNHWFFCWKKSRNKIQLLNLWNSQNQLKIKTFYTPSQWPTCHIEPRKISWAPLGVNKHYGLISYTNITVSIHERHWLNRRSQTRETAKNWWIMAAPVLIYGWLSPSKIFYRVYLSLSGPTLWNYWLCHWWCLVGCEAMFHDNSIHKYY